jgi:transcriptional regulator with XRE-family HTH domain
MKGARMMKLSAIRLERFLKGLSQTALGAEAGLHQRTLSRIENGVRPAKPGERAAIAKALGLKENEIFPEN